MKDSYSFDLTDDGLAASYAAHREAYLRIFARLGLDVRVVSAVSGAMGGSRVGGVPRPTPVGEDTFASCAQCGYAANTEAVPSPRRTAPIAEPGPVEELDTPDTPDDRDAGRASSACRASATLKNLLGRCAGDARSSPIGVPGDREVDLAPGRGAARAGAARSRRPTSPPTPSWSAATSARRAWPGARSGTSPTGGSRPAPAGSPAPTSPTGTPATWSPAATSPSPSTPTWSPWSTATRARVCGGAAGARARRRGRARLPARPQVRRRVRPRRARPGRDAGPADHGLVRDRGVPGGRGRSPSSTTTSAGWSGRARSPRTTSQVVPVGRGRPAGARPRPGRAAGRRPGCGCWSTTGTPRPGSSSPTPS